MRATPNGGSTKSFDFATQPPAPIAPSKSKKTAAKAGLEEVKELQQPAPKDLSGITYISPGANSFKDQDYWKIRLDGWKALFAKVGVNIEGKTPGTIAVVGMPRKWFDPTRGVLVKLEEGWVGFKDSGRSADRAKFKHLLENPNIAEAMRQANVEKADIASILLTSSRSRIVEEKLDYVPKHYHAVIFLKTGTKQAA